MMGRTFTYCLQGLLFFMLTSSFLWGKKAYEGGLQFAINQQDSVFQPVKKIARLEPSVRSNTAEVLIYKGVEFYVYTVDVEQSDISFYYKNAITGRNIGTISQLKSQVENQSKDLLFATNGGIFERDGTPLGLFLDNKSKISSINLREGQGNFYLKPNGVFYINIYGKPHILESQEFYEKRILRGSKFVKHAIQSGPLLIDHGKINSKFNAQSTNRYIRNGVGTFESEINKNKIVFILSRQPVSFYDFAALFQTLGCKRALYLDGAISEMYIKEWDLPTQNNFVLMIGVINK